MIFLDDSVENLRLLMVGFPFLLTSILIIASYGIIWWYVRSKGRNWKSYGHCHVKKAVEKREMQTIWTLFWACFCFFIFVIPTILLEFIDTENMNVNLFFYSTYWLQFSLNFVIYAVRSEQYRKAYGFFLKEVSHCKLLKYNLGNFK